MRKRILRERMTKAQITDLPARALEHVQSVPYAVSLRWVFYRLLQDGIYSRKGDYNRWAKQASKFRHNGTWPPDLLEDTTREPIYRGLGETWSEQEIIEALTDSEQLSVYFHDSHFKRQAAYVELWYEARAMTGQFKEYTEGIVLRPFGGMASIPMKYQAAQDLVQYAARFHKPAKILYFGDLDDAGRAIFTDSTTGHKGFMKWCPADVEVAWCGLTPKQAKRYHVPENPDKPGQYQWEALTDPQAREIIEQAVQKHIDPEAIRQAQADARERAEDFARRLRAALKGMVGGDT